MRKDEHLTVTVFGDHRISRTFLLPKDWVPKLGLLLCVMIGVTVISLGLAVRYYRTASKSQPWRIHELEETISELRKKVAAVPENPIPVPTPTVVAQAPESPLPPHLGSAVESMKSQDGLFTGIPLTSKKPEGTEPLPIEMGDFRAQWAGKTLDVYFSIRYVKGDGGNQQGRIVVLAWGPETLLVYPEGAFNHPETGTLVAPQKGEFFSVSRFREVKAKFGPISKQEKLQKVEVLIFSNQNSLLFHQIFSPSDSKAAPVPTSEPRVAPSTPAPQTQTPSSAP